MRWRVPLFRPFDHERRAVRVAARVAWALAIAALAARLTVALVPVMRGPYFFSSFPLVMLAALVAGTGAGLLCVGVLTVVYGWLFLVPLYAASVGWRGEAIRLTGFAVSAGLIAVVSGALRAAYRREQRLRRRAESSSAALRQLQEAREDLLRALSHDMRTPLATVQLQAELLLRAPAAPPADVSRRADAIRTSARRMTAMLNDLVEMFQLEAGHVKLRRRPVELGPFLAELKGRLEGTLPTERLAVAIPPGLAPVDADPDRLERIVVNLLSNAFKYSGPEAPVAVRAEEDGGRVVLTVLDRGPGVPEVDRARIFDRFYRGSATRGVSGLGLGLYITRLLAEAHGGRVWVDPGEGGSAFRVALPAAAQADGRTPSAGQAAGGA